MNYFTCIYCKESKPFDSYYPYQTHICKKCWMIKQKERRHKTGESKKYINLHGLSYTREYNRERLRIWKINNPLKVKLFNKRYKALKKAGGILRIKTLQMVYEDNIKKFGTLTCYLCLKPISFGKDTLEHKNPLIRGGTNEYSNLAVACQHCNSSKKAKTEEEYRSIVNV